MTYTDQVKRQLPQAERVLLGLFRSYTLGEITEDEWIAMSAETLATYNAQAAEIGAAHAVVQLDIDVTPPARDGEIERLEKAFRTILENMDAEAVHDDE